MANLFNFVVNISMISQLSTHDNVNWQVIERILRLKPSPPPPKKTLSAHIVISTIRITISKMYLIHLYCSWFNETIKSPSKQLTITLPVLTFLDTRCEKLWRKVLYCYPVDKGFKILDTHLYVESSIIWPYLCCIMYTILFSDRLLYK